jgi:hypothetical protein
LKQYDEWYDRQSEVILYRTKIKEMESQNFFNHFACRPGTEILVKKENGGFECFLIGHINSIGGVCDDCVNIYNDVVLYYRKVVEYSGRKL